MENSRHLLLLCNRNKAKQRYRATLSTRISNSMLHHPSSWLWQDIRAAFSGRLVVVAACYETLHVFPLKFPFSSRLNWNLNTKPRSFAYAYKLDMISSVASQQALGRFGVNMEVLGGWLFIKLYYLMFLSSGKWCWLLCSSFGRVGRGM